MYRQKHYSDIVDVAIYIVEETEISGQLLGYWLMHLKCIQHGFVVKRETDELNTVAHIWNTHPIHAQRNRTTPHSRPLIMYTLPHLYGVADHLCPSSRDDILNCEEKCLTRRNYSCDKTVFELCSLLMVERGLDPPGDVYEKVKMGIVRFYLASLDQNRVETTVQVVDNVLEERSSTVDCNVPFNAAESAQVHLPEKVSMHSVSETCTSNSSRNVRSDSLKEMPASHCFLTDSAATECDIGLCSSGNIITSAFVSAIFSSDSEVEFYPFNVESEVCDDTVPWVTSGIPNEYQPVPTSLKPMLETNNPIVCSTPEHRPPNSPVRQEQLITFITSSTPAPSSALQQVHPLPPNSTPAPSSPPLQLSDVYYVTLHRVIIVKDIL
ncbi:UNVERIFIED_CONTAM: hypothetical protein FKN15_056232 [Acipenser sinensis]